MQKKSYQDTEIGAVLKKCREYDDAAFDELVRRYTPMIRKVISGFPETGFGTDELFSEACVALHSAMQKYDLEQSEVTFGLYARTCVYHRLVDLVRKENCAPELVDCDVEMVGYSGIDTAIVARERTEEILSDARSLLSDYEYKVLIYHIQGYKTAAIAAALGKSPKSVDNAKARLFRRLRETLGGILET